MELNGASKSERRVDVRQVDAHLQLSLRIPRNENMKIATVTVIQVVF